MTASTNPMYPVMLFMAAGLMGAVMADALLPWERAGVGGFFGGVIALALIIHLIIRDMDTDPEAAS